MARRARLRESLRESVSAQHHHSGGDTARATRGRACVVLNESMNLRRRKVASPNLADWAFFAGAQRMESCKGRRDAHRCRSGAIAVAVMRGA
jgi:hypothetical protein